jgi:hypothetical protein
VSKIFRFNPSRPLPIAFATLKGKFRTRPVKLVFDTGAFMTQLSTRVVEELGYSASDGINRISAYGPSGPIDEGYSLKVAEFRVFGKSFQNLTIAAYDFTNLESDGIDGLLGFDIVKQLHLELNGPKGEVTIFDH